MRLPILLLLVLYGISQASLLGQAPRADTEVRLRLDSAQMLIGSPNRLLVSGPLELSAVDFSALDTMKDFVPLGPVQDSLAAGRRYFILPFSVYDSVGLLFPRLPAILGAETTATNNVALLVTFPPNDSLVYSFRDIIEEEAKLSDFIGLIILGIFVLLLAAFALWFFYFRQNPPAVLQAQAPRPAHEIALADLEQLRGSSLDDKSYYSRLDYILRRYLESRYGIPALVRTSSELGPLLEPDQLPRAELMELLQAVDLVKFAKAGLSIEQRETSLDRVEQFVRQSALPLTDQKIEAHD